MKILVISLSSQIPPVLYGGAEELLIMFSFMSRNFSVNLLAGKGSQNYSGKTLNYEYYKFGTSFFGRCFSWIEFQTQCMIN